MEKNPFFVYTRWYSVLFWCSMAINVVGMFIAGYGLAKLAGLFLS